MQDEFEFSINGVVYRAHGTPVGMSLADFLQEQWINLRKDFEHLSPGSCFFLLGDYDGCSEPVWRLVKASNINLSMLAGRELWAIDVSSARDAGNFFLENPGIRRGEDGVQVSLSSTISNVLSGLDDGCGYGSFRDALGSVLQMDRQFSGESLQGLKRSSVSLNDLQSVAFEDREGSLFYRPSTVAEVIRLRVMRSGANVVAGKRFYLRDDSEFQSNVLIYLECVSELREILSDKDSWEIGSCVSIRSLAERLGVEFPLIGDLVAGIKDAHLLNRNTVWDELSCCDSGTGLVAVFLSHDAKVIVDDLEGHRVVRLDALLTDGGNSSVGEQELIRAVLLPRTEAGCGLSSYYKVFKEPLDCRAFVGAAFFVEINDDGIVQRARICYDLGSGWPARIQSAEDFLKGEVWGPQAAQKVSEILNSEVEIPESGQVSTEYRKVLIVNLWRKFFEEHKEPQTGFHKDGTVMTCDPQGTDKGAI